MDKILRGRPPEILRMRMDEIMQKIDPPEEAEAYLAPICADSRLITLYARYGMECVIVEVSELTWEEVEELTEWLLYGLAKGRMSLRDNYEILNSENRRIKRERNLEIDAMSFYKFWSLYPERRRRRHVR